MKKIIPILILLFVFVLPVHASRLSDLKSELSGLLGLVKNLQYQLSQMNLVSEPIVQEGSVVELPNEQCLFDVDLWIGVRSTYVSDVQKLLKKEGYYLYPEITNYYGPVTEAAVKAFQKASGVVSGGTANSTGYGVVGPATRKALIRVCNGIVTPVSAQITNIVNNNLTIKTKNWPEKIKVGDVGIWGVSAVEKNNEPLSFVVEWGDGISERSVASYLKSGSDVVYEQRIKFKHKYITTGEYTVTLMVSGVSQKGTRISKKVKVVNGPSGIISDIFFATKKTGVAPLTVTFNANVGGKTQCRYFVDADDGSVPNSVNCYAPYDVCTSAGKIVHTYNKPGTYTAKLIGRWTGPEYSQQSLSCDGIIKEEVISVADVRAHQQDTDIFFGGCMNNGIKYKNGSKLGCVYATLTNEICAPDDSNYVCRLGVWKVEKESDEVEANIPKGSCKYANEWYADGIKREKCSSSLRPVDGSGVMRCSIRNAGVAVPISICAHGIWIEEKVHAGCRNMSGVIEKHNKRSSTLTDAICCDGAWYFGGGTALNCGSGIIQTYPSARF